MGVLGVEATFSWSMVAYSGARVFTFGFAGCVFFFGGLIILLFVFNCLMVLLLELLQEVVMLLLGAVKSCPQGLS